MLIENYIKYYQHQNKDALNNLFNSLMEYSFFDYQHDISTIYNIWQNTQLKPTFEFTITSNGGSKYEFAPYFFDWCKLIENKLRKRTTYNIAVTHSLGNFNKVLPHHHQFDEIIQADPERHLSQLLAELNKYDFPIALTIQSDYLFALSTNPHFTENIREIQFINNSDLPLFNKTIDIPINDQMINWKSGFNFYTCKAGEKHFLPIFYNNGQKTFNLLNLAQKDGDESDQIIVFDAEQCHCGQERCKVEFISHVKNNFTIDNLPDKLNGVYSFLQFLKDDKIKIFYRLLDKQNDFDLLGSLFPDAEFIENKYFIIGQKKRMPFWKLSDNNIRYVNVDYQGYQFV